MALYALSDFHLDLSKDKPMDVFGDKWLDHDEKIKTNWLKDIKETDTVIIGGDISWSMSMKDGLKELQWINELPGNKILIRGNHDYWWSSISKLNSLYKNMSFIQNNFFTYDDIAICGSRGWICPGNEKFSGKDEKIYNRELIRFRLSLEQAKTNGYEKIIAVIHYPPMNENFGDTGFIQLFKEYNVSKVIYGHLHGPFTYNVCIGINDGIEYILTSSDYLDFKPIKIF
jgi:predicted phosphohydrolase